MGSRDQCYYRGPVGGWRGDERRFVHDYRRTTEPRLWGRQNVPMSYAAFTVTADGTVQHPKIVGNIIPGIEKGELTAVNGIVVHQTNAATAQRTLDDYANIGAQGAHFLIARDGQITQTASLTKKTWHVGKLRSRCVAQSTCSATEITRIKSLGPTARHALEKVKSFPNRYPMNEDSIGIEIVGDVIHDNKGVPVKDPDHPREALYEVVNEAQNNSLAWLTFELAQHYGIMFQDIYRHPTISQKTPSEASTANWDRSPWPRD